MNNDLAGSSTRTGTIGGTVLVLLLQVNPGQLLTTIITAATGATVSFIVSVGCKYISNRLLKKKNRGG